MGVLWRKECDVGRGICMLGISKFSILVHRGCKVLRSVQGETVWGAERVKLIQRDDLGV